VDVRSNKKIPMSEKDMLLSELATMFGEFKPDLDKLSIDELKKLKRFLLNQLAPYYVDADIVELAGRDAIDKVDVGYHTFLRLWQVFSYVIINNSNSDAEHPDSSFNHTMGRTPVAWALGMLFVFPAALGVLIRYRQLVHKRERNSLQYQQAQIHKINLAAKLTEKEILDAYNDLLIRGKVTLRNITIQEVEANKPLIEKVVTPNKLANFINNKITHNPIIQKIEKAWRFLSDTSLIFWPTWMIAVMIIGITAASFPPALPIIVAVTIGASLLFQGTKLIHHLKKKKSEAAENQNRSADKIQEDKSDLIELSRIRNELKQRLHMKQEHAYFKSLFGGNSHPLQTKGDKNRFIATATQNQSKEKVIVFIENPDFNQSPIPPEQASAARISDEEHERKIREIGISSKIGNYLLGSKGARNRKIAVNMLMAAINNYTQAAFVLWLFSAVFGALAPVAAVFGTLAAVVGGGLMFASFGGIVGALYSIRTFAETRIAQIEFEKDIYSRLAETYKGKPKGHTFYDESKEDKYYGKAKYEVFDLLAAEVEEKKSSIKNNLAAKQQKIRDELKRGITPDKKDTYILNYDLKKIDVYNDRYFETQQEKPSLWVKIQKGLFRTYKAINAGQTSIFVVRSLFLAGAVLGGMCLLFGPAAGFAFIAIALTCAAIGIALKLTQLHMERKAEHKKFFVDTIDARISYLKKKNKQLMILSNELSNEKSDKANINPSPSSNNTLEIMMMETAKPDEQQDHPIDEDSTDKKAESTQPLLRVSPPLSTGANLLLFQKKATDQALPGEMRPLPYPSGKSSVPAC
jgi:ABC-type multidrug transport system fused ATPase/permease subunit